MSDISIQFYAHPEELCVFVKQCIHDFNLQVVAMRFSPFEAIRINATKIDSIFLGSDSYQELALTINAPILPAKSNTDFFDKNPNKLRIDIPSIGPKGLKQAWLTTRSNDLQSSHIWKQIANRLKSITQAGVTSINPDSMKATVTRMFRYTSGAKNLEISGIPMLPVGGGCLVKLGIEQDL